MGIEWLQVAVNAVVVLGAVGGFAAWYRGYLIREVKFAVNEQMVPKAEYEKDKAAMLLDINQIKKFDREFAVLKNQIEHLQSDTKDIKAAVGGLSGEITGAIARVAELSGKVSR